MKYLIFVVIFLLTTACAKDNPIVVDPEFQPYLDAFEAEARKRNLDITAALDKVSIVFEDISDATVSGRCNTQSTRVSIDSIWWMRLDLQERRHLIFHELGHCVLKRPHLDDQNDCLECQSYMRSGSYTCSANYYSDNWYTFYMDELFEVTETEWPSNCGATYENTSTGELLIDTTVSQLTNLIFAGLRDENARYVITSEVYDWLGQVTASLINVNDIQMRYRSPPKLCIYQTTTPNQWYPFESSKVFYCNSGFDLIQWNPVYDPLRLQIEVSKQSYKFILNGRIFHEMEYPLTPSDSLIISTGTSLPVGVRVTIERQE